MKKWMIRFMSVLAVFAFSVGVTGCNQGEENGGMEGDAEEMEKQTEEAAEGVMEEADDSMDKE